MQHVGHFDVAPDQAVQALDRVLMFPLFKGCDGVFDGKADPSQNHPQQRLFAFDIVIDRAHAQAAGLGQVAGGGGMKSLAPAKVQRRQNDLFQVGNRDMFLLDANGRGELPEYDRAQHARGQLTRAQLHRYRRDVLQHILLLVPI